MLRILIAVVAVAAVVILGIAWTKPDHFEVQRSLSVKAAPDEVFPLVNDFSNWDDWSPWAKKDPAMEQKLSGATSGLGAVYEWSGNADVGRGRMEIVDMSPPNRINIRLDFLKPFPASNDVRFTFVPDGEFTDVTWYMTGPTPFVGKVISVFVPMDGMVGPDFEAGLRNLKAIAER